MPRFQHQPMELELYKILPNETTAKIEPMAQEFSCLIFTAAIGFESRSVELHNNFHHTKGVGSTQRAILMKSANGYQFNYWYDIVGTQREKSGTLPYLLVEASEGLRVALDFSRLELIKLDQEKNKDMFVISSLQTFSTDRSNLLVLVFRTLHAYFIHCVIS